uniref:Uncharacterized protein n=1 Tax=Gossypium raimondii TaxID=29730 RepID=A0A0D2VCQ3_GOSRA|nr:hypothetical protein B456_013G091400 [Gossypium raimondii]
MSSVISVTAKLCLPNYILFTSSARMLSLFSCFPSIPSSIPKESLPPMLLDSNSSFTKNFSDDSGSLKHFNGVLINSFEELEKEPLEMLASGNLTKGLPLVFPLGPFLPLELERISLLAPLKWLENQEESSVVYVSFGSRTSMSKEQIRELGYGLVLSRCKFLWVVKSKVVDKEEEEGLDEILGHQLMKNIENNGLVVKEWVDQWQILSQKAVGGFISHWMGIEPFGERCGDWGKIKELVGNQRMKMECARISEVAKQRSKAGEGCENMLKTLFQSLKKS